MPLALPHAPITHIAPTPKPAAVPSLWNQTYDEIDANFAYLKAQIEQLSNTSTVLISAPALTGSSKLVIGNPYILSMYSVTLLPGSQVASFTVTKPDGSSQTIAATAGVASLNWTESSGALGDQLTFSVYATDNYGNRSVASTKTVTLSAAYINTPTISSPVQGATSVGDSFVIQTAAFGVTGGADTHQLSDFEVRTESGGGGSVVWSSIGDTVNKLSITVPRGFLQIKKKYYARARHKGTNFGYGDYAEVSFTTADAFVPTEIGQPYQGGYYAGRIKIGTDVFAIVVSPRSVGESSVALAWKNDTSQTAAAISLVDGYVNTQALDSATHPAAAFCKSLNIGGYTDWYLPSRDELELLYRNFKSTTVLNAITARTASNVNGSANGTPVGCDGLINGYNPSSYPVGDAYTSAVPDLTKVAQFVVGGGEEFLIDYWSSTHSAISTTGSYVRVFYTSMSDAANFNAIGGQRGAAPTALKKVRAIRRVLLPGI